jgi:hypothetical protein
LWQVAQPVRNPKPDRNQKTEPQLKVLEVVVLSNNFPQLLIKKQPSHNKPKKLLWIATTQQQTKENKPPKKTSSAGKNKKHLKKPELPSVSI